MPPIALLEKRVNDLAARFLDDQIKNEPNSPFVVDLDAIAAFRLLVHAEIEEWLEKTARQEIKSLTNLVTKPLIVRNLYRMVLLAALFSVELPLLMPFDEKALRAKFDAALSEAKEFVDNNNGIKSATFCRIAIICGSPPDEIDVLLSTALDSYGKSRGDVAHKSIKSVPNLLAPSAEKAEALTLITNIKLFFSKLVPI